MGRRTTRAKAPAQGPEEEAPSEWPLDLECVDRFLKMLEAPERLLERTASNSNCIRQLIGGLNAVGAKALLCLCFYISPSETKYPMAKIKAPSKKIFVDGFDAEQIWEQLQMQHVPQLHALHKRILELEKLNEPKPLTARQCALFFLQTFHPTFCSRLKREAKKARKVFFLSLRVSSTPLDLGAGGWKTRENGRRVSTRRGGRRRHGGRRRSSDFSSFSFSLIQTLCTQHEAEVKNFFLKISITLLTPKKGRNWGKQRGWRCGRWGGRRGGITLRRHFRLWARSPHSEWRIRWARRGQRRWSFFYRNVNVSYFFNPSRVKKVTRMKMMMVRCMARHWIRNKEKRRCLFHSKIDADRKSFHQLQAAKRLSTLQEKQEKIKNQIAKVPGKEFTLSRISNSRPKFSLGNEIKPTFLHSKSPLPTVHFHTRPPPPTHSKNTKHNPQISNIEIVGLISDTHTHSWRKKT